jgi:hypothetical protein
MLATAIPEDSRHLQAPEHLRHFASARRTADPHKDDDDRKTVTISMEERKNSMKRRAEIKRNKQKAKDITERTKNEKNKRKTR